MRVVNKRHPVGLVLRPLFSGPLEAVPSSAQLHLILWRRKDENKSNVTGWYRQEHNDK